MKKSLLLFPLFAGVCTLLFVWFLRGTLFPYPDTKVYLGQIGYFNGEIAADMDIQLRSFKPFYGVVGSALSNVVSPEVAILIINVAFFFGLIVATYFLLKELGFEELYASIGAGWVATGYPLLKYGLALLTDISGWFFAGATICLFLVGIRKNNTWFLVGSSLVAFIGSLCKETGVLGLGFAGVYLLGFFVVTRNVAYIKKIVAILLPFLFLQAGFLYLLFTNSSTHTSFLYWFLLNKHNVGSELHTFYNFVQMEFSTFNLLWIYVLYGIYQVYKYRLSIERKHVIIGLSLLLCVLPPLVWPVFLTRILYIGYLVIVPIALLGLVGWRQNNTHKNYLFSVLVAFPVVISFSLFAIAGGISLYSVLEKLS